MCVCCDQISNEKGFRERGFSVQSVRTLSVLAGMGDAGGAQGCGLRSEAVCSQCSRPGGTESEECLCFLFGLGPSSMRWSPLSSGWEFSPQLISHGMCFRGTLKIDQVDHEDWQSCLVLCDFLSLGSAPVLSVHPSRHTRVPSVCPYIQVGTHRPVFSMSYSA